MDLSLIIHWEISAQLYVVF